MNPEQKAQFDEMYADFKRRQVQQIRYPLDEASRNTLGTSSLVGSGSTTTTQTIVIPAGGGSASVPVNPLGTIVVDFGSGRYEIPYIAQP